MKAIKKIVEDGRHLGNDFIIEIKQEVGITTPNHSWIDKIINNLKHILNQFSISIEDTTIGNILESPLQLIDEGIDIAGDLTHDIVDLLE